MDETYPALTRLFGAYLNQDVFEFYPDEFAGAADFATDDPQDAQVAADEIDHVLANNATEDGLQRTLQSLHVEIRPVDLTYREWLTQIADHVRASLAKRAPGA